MKKSLSLLLFLAFIIGTRSVWAQPITVTIVDGTNAPYDTYGARNSSANTFTSNAASGLAGVVITAPVIDRYNGWWSKYCLALCPSATQTAEAVTITAPEGYLLLSVNMTAQANSSYYPYDVVFNGSTTNVTGASAQTFSKNNIFAPSFSFTINHTAASFDSSNKWFAVKSMTLQLVKIITSTDQISANKSYFLKCDRSALAVANGGTTLSTTSTLDLALSIPDAKQRFAFVTPNDGTDYYLYSVNVQKFLQAQGSAGNMVGGSSADKIFMEDASSFRAGTWRFYLKDPSANKNINVGGSSQVIIDDYSTKDAGNCFYIIEAADVDGAALVELLKPISVTWNVVSEANGSAVATGSSDAYRTEALALPSDLSRPFCTYEYFSDAACTEAITSFASNEAATSATIYAKYTFTGFSVSETFNTATWYYLKIKDANYTTYISGRTPNVTLPTTNAGDRTTQWAFFGNPYDGFTIKNRAAGNNLVLGSAAAGSNDNNGGNTYATLSAPGSQTYELWFPASSGYITNGLFLNNGQNYALNQRSTDNLAYWTGGKDKGSTFVLEEATDEVALAILRANYEISATNLDKPGFPTTEAYNTFRSTIEGFSSLEAWEEGIDDAVEDIRPSVVYPNGTYYIKNRNTGCYAFITDDGELVPRIKIDNTVSHTNNNYLWAVTSDKNAGTCSIVSSLYSNVPFAKGENNYANITSSNRTVITTLSTELFSSNNGTSGAFYLNGAHNSNVYTGNGEGSGNSHVVSWNKQDSYGSQWIFEPADLGTDYTVTVEGLADGGQDAVTLSDGTIVNLGIGTVYLSETPTTSNITQSEITGYSIQDGSIVVDTGNHTITVTYSPSYDVLIANYWTGNDIAAKLNNAGQYGYPALDNEYTVYLNGVGTAIVGGTYTGNATNYNNLRTWYEGFLAAEYVKPADGTFIRIRSTQGGKAYLKAASAGSRMTVTTTEDKNIIFLYSGGKLIAYTHGIAINNVREIGTAGGAASSFTFVNAVNGNIGCLSLAATYSNNTNYLYSTGVNGDDADRNTASTEFANKNTFTIEDVTSLPVTISSAGYASLYAPVALSIPPGVMAYTAVDEGAYLKLTAIEDNIIPANTGVILAGGEGSYEFTITTGGTAESELTGTTETIAKPADAYYLSNGESGIGFYKGGTATTMAGFKAYLDGGSGSSSVKAFLFADDADAIRTAFAGESDDVRWYDLSGRRVAQPKRGLYIQNGKKVIIK